MKNNSAPVASSTGSLFLNAALLGLMGMTACSKDDSKVITPETQAQKGPEITLTRDAPSVTLASFQADCQAVGGLVQTHATCSGTNSCRGFSFNKFSNVLIEHTCKGINTCGGLSCVELLKDSGKTATVVYDDNCVSCHGAVDAENLKDESAFKLYTPEGASALEAETEFRNASLEKQVSVVAFGTHGLNADGTAFSNMPAFYEKLSRAEIERVVTYIKALTPRAEEYTAFGGSGGH